MSSKDSTVTKIVIVVVGGSILASVTYVAGRIWPAFEQWIVGSISTIAAVVAAPVSVPLWLFLPIFAFALLPIVGFVLGRRKSFPRTTTWRDFKEAEYFGVVWRWLYERDDTIIHLIPYCLHCNLQLNTSERYISQYQRGTEFHCDDCGQVATMPDEKVEAWKKVSRRIYRDIANEVWKGK